MTWDVIIPVKNMAAFLSEAVGSVLKMVPEVHQIIIVNDGSTDHPETAVTHPKIRWIHHGNSLGKSTSRNEGIEASTADFINFLDADDFMEPLKVQKQLDFLTTNPQFDAVFGDMIAFEDGHPPEQGEFRSYEKVSDLLTQLIRKNTLSIHAFLWKRDFFPRFGFFDPYFEISQDRELYIRSMIQGAQISYQPGSTVYYRRHAKSSIKSKQYEAAHFNAQAVVKNASSIMQRFPGRYDQELADSIRMLARNANIHGRPLAEVYALLEAAFSTKKNSQIVQSRLYYVLETLLGPSLLELLLRPKFFIDRRLKTFK